MALLMADDSLYIQSPTLFVWRCINGHEFLIESNNFFFMVMTFVGLDGKKIVKEVPVCPFCYADWIAGHVAELKCVGKANAT